MNNLEGVQPSLPTYAGARIAHGDVERGMVAVLLATRTVAEDLYGKAPRLVCGPIASGCDEKPEESLSTLRYYAASYSVGNYSNSSMTHASMASARGSRRVGGKTKHRSPLLQATGLTLHKLPV